jgi:chromosome partitioning protein
LLCASPLLCFTRKHFSRATGNGGINQLGELLKGSTLGHLSTSESRCYSVVVIITIAGMKGGVAKTTTAMQIAGNLSDLGPTVLIDGDPNQSALGWSKRSSLLPFPVIGVHRAVSEARKYKHIVMDTKARPDMDELRDLVEGCDLLVIPTTPDALALEGMMLTVRTLDKLDAKNYRVLLTIIPPAPSKAGEDARSALRSAGIPLFARGIRRTAAFQTAAAEGVLVGQVKGSDQAILGARDYELVTEEICSVIESRSYSVTT